MRPKQWLEVVQQNFEVIRSKKIVGTLLAASFEDKEQP
jgi:hypothetical protein